MQWHNLFDVCPHSVWVVCLLFSSFPIYDFYRNLPGEIPNAAISLPRSGSSNFRRTSELSLPNN